MSLFGLIFLAAAALCFVGIVILLITLVRRGDERRRMIVEKSCAFTFIVMAVYLIFCAIEDFFSTVKGTDAVRMLSLLTIVYFITLLYNKKKYGD